MIGIKHHHGTSVANHAAHLRDNRRIDARPNDIADTGMLRPNRLRLDVDRDNATMPDLVKYHCCIERAAAELGARLDYHIRPGADQQLLVNPQVEGALVDEMTEPAQMYGVATLLQP